uniref:Uncharacterized protein n=1 Tax=Anguilla anguilla TaxID=7936 RepID=A0A0E9QH89_ANGAN
MFVSELWLSCLPSPLSQSMFEPGDGSVMIKSITFTLKETVCPKSEDYLKEECVFKDNGVSSHCPYYPHNV